MGALHVRQCDIGNGGIQRLYDGRQHDRDRQRMRGGCLGRATRCQAVQPQNDRSADAAGDRCLSRFPHQTGGATAVSLVAVRRILTGTRCTI